MRSVDDLIQAMGGTGISKSRCLNPGHNAPHLDLMLSKLRHPPEKRRLRCTYKRAFHVWHIAC
jgi:hypothetical protein